MRFAEFYETDEEMWTDCLTLKIDLGKLGIADENQARIVMIQTHQKNQTSALSD